MDTIQLTKCLAASIFIHFQPVLINKYFRSQQQYLSDVHQTLTIRRIMLLMRAALTAAVFPPLQDAFDAVGYFQLALAAALEDQANPEALYVVYMKLAEIHGHHMPDAQLCQVYRDRAQSLKRVLAGVEGAAGGEEHSGGAVTEPGHVEEKDPETDVEHAQSLPKINKVFTSTLENEKCEGSPSPRTCVMHKATEDINMGDTNRKQDDNINLPDADGPFIDAFGSEAEATGGHSYSDSLLTESFDTAQEQITDSSSSTDTLKTCHNMTHVKESDCDAARGHTGFNHTGDIAALTESDEKTEKPASADQAEAIEASTEGEEHMDVYVCL